MTITVELPPETEANLLSRARAQGMTLDAYLEWMIERISATQAPAPLSLAEFEAELDELAQGSERLPVLPASAYTREGIYGNG